MNAHLCCPTGSGILLPSCADVRPESAVIDPPCWLELGYKSISVSITKSAAAGVLAMSEDQIAAARQRESERQPFGFQAPDRAVKRKSRKRRG